MGKIFDAAIIGAGAAGMMAAVNADSGNKSIALIDHNDRIGKKILSTGNGRCNLSNTDMDIRHFHGGNKDRIERVIRNFDHKDTVDFFNDLGVITMEKGGYTYPNTCEAKTILNAFFMEIKKRKNIDVFTGYKVKKISDHENKLWEISDNKKEVLAKSVVISSGGMAAKKLGSDGSIFPILKELGINIIPMVPALGGLVAEEDYFKKIAGIRTDAKISLEIDGKTVKKEQGNLQVTKEGISGIPVFNISRYAARGLNEKKKVRVITDLFPKYDKEEIKSNLQKIRMNFLDEEIQNGFSLILDKKLAILFCRILGIRPSLKLKDMDDENIDKYSRLVKNWSIRIKSPWEFDRVQATAGGVDMGCLTDELESICKKGLFFAGEAVDVDGDCGGYNLQWAWSSGYLVGKSIAKRGI